MLRTARWTCRFGVGFLALALVSVSALVLACMTAGQARAAIVVSGDVDPEDSSAWHSETYLFVGKTAGGTLNLSGGSSATVNDVLVGYNSSASGVVYVDLAGSRLTANGSLIVGDSGWGTLELTRSGDASSSQGFIGFNVNSTGEVTVDGSGSTWSNSGDISVGEHGNGTLNILSNGSVNVVGNTWAARLPGSQGEIHFGGGSLSTESLMAGVAHLTGTGTVNTNGLVSDIDLTFDDANDMVQTIAIDSLPGQDITVNLNINGQGFLGAGYAGSGSLTIRNGVTVNTFAGYLGYHSGSTGVAEVTDANSVWASSDNLYVGQYGSGTLNITNGGVVRNKAGYIGYESGSTGKVTVDGAAWANNRYLTVGLAGSGTLNITNGGVVSNTGGDIAYDPNSAGVISVDGNGSTWSSSAYIFIGRHGSGTMNITNGGTVNNRYGYIGYEPGSSAEVTVDGAGSVWTNVNDLLVGTAGSATVKITNGGLLSVGELTISDDGNGDDFINMTTGGMLALEGEADDSLVDFLGLIVGSDALFYWDDSNSGWADITGATPGVDYRLEYLTTGDLAGFTMLTVGGPCDDLVADIAPVATGGDGIVDGADLGAMLARWKDTGDSIADIAPMATNGNGIVDSADLGMLLARWKNTCTTAAPAPAVPEPATLAMLAFGVMGLLRRARRQAKTPTFPADETVIN